MKRCDMCDVAYRTVPVQINLNDTQGELPKMHALKCSLSNICTAFDKISTDIVCVS